MNLRVFYILFFLSLLCDLTLFLTNYSFRFVFYETLLVVFAYKNLIFSAFLFLLSNLLKLLQIYFSVNIFTLSAYSKELIIFISIFTLIILIYKNGIKSLFISLSFLTIFIFFDKVIFKDRLATSIVYYSYQNIVNKNANKIESTVYNKIQELLTLGPLVVINWESLGVPNDKKNIHSILNENPSLEFEEIIINPRSTIVSEYDYLCGLSLGLISDTKSCIPSMIPSIALHGNVGHFYNRVKLYKIFGFKNFLFKEHLLSYSKCYYSFIGICDKDLFEVGLNQNMIRKYKFIYILSLDSHFPYIKYDDHVNGLVNDLKLAVQKFKKCCAKKASLLIIGDHPPAFSNGFKENRVSSFVLKIKK